MGSFRGLFARFRAGFSGSATDERTDRKRSVAFDSETPVLGSRGLTSRPERSRSSLASAALARRFNGDAASRSSGDAARTRNGGAANRLSPAPPDGAAGRRRSEPDRHRPPDRRPAGGRGRAKRAGGTKCPGRAGLETVQVDVEKRAHLDAIRADVDQPDVEPPRVIERREQPVGDVHPLSI
jgi:hypothetical protein